jgi:hypothetical protein
MENKHEALVRKIAEEMATEWEARHIDYKDYDYFRSIVEDYLPAARIAVIFAADTLIEYAYGGDKFYYLTYHEGKEDFDKILIDMGLIPNTENKENETDN